MAHFLWSANFTPEAMQGVKKEGGTSRRATIEKMISDAGGTLEAFYFAFGADDVYLIVELPDNVSAAAIAMTVGASGSVSVETTVLLTPEEVDEAVKKTVAYRAPGQ